LEAVKLDDLLLSLAQRGRMGEGLRHRLASHPAGEPKLRIMSRIVELGTMAGALAAASGHSRNGTWPKVAQAEESFQEREALGFQSCKIIRHKRGSFLSVYIRSA
jgi:hypothetical protein